jgi:hypothetical protein
LAHPRGKCRIFDDDREWFDKPGRERVRELLLEIKKELEVE